MPITGPQTTATSPVPVIVTGQYPAKATVHYPRELRAYDAARWVRGEIQVLPTTKLAATVFGVPAACVSAEVKALEAAEQLNAAGNDHGGNGHSAGLLLAEYILRATPAERQHAADVVGCDVIWDSMISPLLNGNGHHAAE